MQVTLWIFRHGQTDWNAQERFQGHIDVPLNDIGRTQARALVPKLMKTSLEVILSSDLSRALETASIAASELKVPIFQDSRLREAHLGEAQGLTRIEIETQFGKALAHQWHSHLLTDADISYPGGETGIQVMNRVFEALRHFIESNPFRKIGVATHGGVIRRVMQKLQPPGAPSVAIPNGVVYEFHYDRQRKEFFIQGVPIPLKSD
jgi:probable phosphoglycerate mutase